MAKESEATPKTPPPADTITVKVDGREIQAPRTTPDPITGKPVPTTMIQACALAGVDVPHYCYHPKLPVAGNCRMCLVEYGMPAMGPDRKPVLNDDGTPQIAKQVLPYERSTPRGAIACATPIAPNMEIYPSSDATKQMREAVLESLLINHPLDCPICDQAGECKLQEYSIEHGQSKSRFVETKVHKPKQVDLGPRIMLDDERCVLCSRCVRFTRDIVGDDALGFVDRGSYNTLTHFPGKPFDNNYTLNTVDICPVGALTSKDFRFRMRVWFLKETKSLCASCGTGCNTSIGSREGAIQRFEPRENDAVNACWMCDHGRLNYKWIASEDRLDEVRIRRPRGRQHVASWKQANAEITDRLRAAAPGSVAVIASAGQTTEELYLLSKLARSLDALCDAPANQGDGDHLLVSADKNPNSNGARLTRISGKRLGAKIKKIVEGVKAADITTLIVFGVDITQIGFPRHVIETLECLIVSDVLENETTEAAHYLLPGCAHVEKRGTFVNVKGRLQKFMKAVEPPGEARPEWETLHEWVEKVTEKNGFSTIEGLFNAMADDLKPLHGLRWADIGDLGVDIDI